MAPRVPPVAAVGDSSLRKLRFLVGGAFNAATCVVFSQVAYHLTGAPVVAFGLGYAASLSLSYVVNALWVFRVGRLSVLGYLGFCVSYVPNFAVQFVLVAAMTRWLGLYPFLAYLLGVAIAVPITFLVLDRVTFRTRADGPLG